jgi:signal transduction histidine kinase
MSLVRTKIGQELMAQLHGLVAEMREIEGKLVIQQTNDWLSIHAKLRVLSVISTLVTTALILLAGYLVTKDIRRRTEVASGLESEVQQKNQELSELSTHLQRISEGEKSSLARELHDELGGLLVAVKMDFSQLRSKLDLTQPDIQKRWDRIQAALSSGIDLKRRVIEQLRPSLLDNMGLVAAIRWQAEEICSAANMELVQRYPETEPDISGDGSIALFRIVQEALTNIVKHARASRVTIQLAITDHDLVLMIEDNGVGLSIGHKAGSVTAGMKSMRHRVLPFDGQFAVEQVEPTGTRIRVKVSLARISTFASHAP